MEKRMTYAQSILYELVVTRKLKSWCVERNLPHSTIFKVAVGDAIPTYSVICSLLPYIPATDWYFFTDEQVLFERKTIEAWDPDKTPAYIRQHKHEWKEQGEKFGMTETFAKNLFVNHRARPTINMVRQCALEGIDPIEFFSAGDMEDDGIFYPEKGDVVELFGKTFVVMSENKWNETNSAFFGVQMIEDQPQILTAGVYTFQRKYPKYAGKAEKETLLTLKNNIKEIIK